MFSESMNDEINMPESRITFTKFWTDKTRIKHSWLKCAMLIKMNQTFPSEAI